MSEKFAKKWGEGVDDTPSLSFAADRFSDRDKSIFAKIVNAYTKHDMVTTLV